MPKVRVVAVAATALGVLCSACTSSNVTAPPPPSSNVRCDVAPDGLALATDAPSPPGASWTADYETADLSQFRNTPWNSQPLAPAVSSRTARSGRYAGAYSIPAGGSRSENIPPGTLDFTEGDVRWFAFSTLLGPRIPTATEWQVITQWKNDGDGSPPLALYIEDGSFVLGGGWGWPGTNNPENPKQESRAVGLAVAEVWDDWVMRVSFSADPTKGSVSLWRNGENRVCDWQPRGGTLYPSLYSYLKIGYYRFQGITWPETVYLDDVRIGPTRSSVEVQTGGSPTPLD